MKEKIHPKYVPAKIICACGNIIETLSLQPEIHVEICSACHPFYTGQKKLVDTAGRIDKFKERLEKVKKLQTTKKIKTKKRSKSYKR